MVNIKALKYSIQNIVHRSISMPVLVIESDDWGAQRMPSMADYNGLLAKGVALDQNPLDQVDTLESAEDLNMLYELLRSFRDAAGKHPKITANFVTSNPNYEAIRSSGYSNYSSELITQSYERYARARVWDAIQAGIKNGLIEPQYHGREHIHIGEWMRLLYSNDHIARMCFDHEMYTFPVTNSQSKRSNIMAAFDNIGYTSTDQYRIDSVAIFEDGLAQFKDLFGSRPSSFISPCYVWPAFIEETAHKNKITSIQGGLFQLIPDSKSTRYKRKLRYTGQKKADRPLQLVRNVYLEPSSAPSFDWVSTALKKTSVAFALMKPVIVSMHRANFVGGLDAQNRNRGLRVLKEYLTAVTTKWPDVRFVSSSELAGMILNNKVSP